MHVKPFRAVRTAEAPAIKTRGPRSMRRVGGACSATRHPFGPAWRVTPALRSSARGGCAPPSSRRPAAATTRGASFDDLGGAGEDRWRDGEAEFVRGLQIDDQLEFRRLLNWQ